MVVAIFVLKISRRPAARYSPRRSSPALHRSERSPSGTATDIRPLPIDLGWIVGDREIDAQQRSVADLLRVEDDLDGFGVVGGTSFGQLVGGRFRAPAGIAGRRADDALDMLEYPLNAPEAASGEDGGLRASRRLLAASWSGGGTSRGSSTAGCQLPRSGGAETSASTPPRTAHGERIANRLEGP